MTRTLENSHTWSTEAKAIEVSPHDWTVLRLDGYIACNGCGAKATTIFRRLLHPSAPLDRRTDPGSHLATCSDCQVTEAGWVQVLPHRA